MFGLFKKRARDDLGVLTVLLRRARTQRIPRLLKILEAMQDGARLSYFQIAFLRRVHKDLELAMPYYERHPEVQSVVIKMVDLYHDITERAMANEQAKLREKTPRIELPDQSE